MTGTVWVRTQPSASGRTYVVTIDFTDDLSRTLKPTEASEHARYVLAAAMQADHDAAVFRQLSDHGLELEAIAETVRALREDRPPLRTAQRELTLEPGVNPEGGPFIRVSLDGQAIGQWTVADARSHAQGVLEAVHAADLDAAYYRHLVGVVGLDEPTARAAVGDLLGRVTR